jgi:C4-dicarboxylate-specific signal transduction histidine kinase
MFAMRGHALGARRRQEDDRDSGEARGNPGRRSECPAGPAQLAFGPIRDEAARANTGPMSAIFASLAAVAAVVALLFGLLVQHRALCALRRQLRMRDAELAHAARLAAAGELSASIAHEINQPLGAILANADAAEMLLSRPQASLAEVRSILADIRADDLRAHEVIRRLRGLLERREAERRQMDIHAAVNDAFGLLAGEARRRRVELVFQRGAVRGNVLGDRVQLQQVLLNLLLNAMDASAGLPAALRRVHVETSDEGDDVVVSVSDRGTGFGKLDGEALFASFFSTKQDGLGLGLSIARAIVQAHEGTIHAAPREQGGAVFTMRLPALSVADVPARARVPSAPAAHSAALA